MTEKRRELWTKRIEDYRASDLTAVKWCEENNVPVHKLRYKITQFNKEKKQTLKETQWASIIPKMRIIFMLIYKFSL